MAAIALVTSCTRRKAQRKAEAEFSLTQNPKAMHVRWVRSTLSVYKCFFWRDVLILQPKKVPHHRWKTNTTREV